MFSLDFLGAAFAIAATVAFAFASVVAWPLSLIAISLDLILYFKLQIYGDALLQMGYFVMSIYGWWVWLRPSVGVNSLQIRWLTMKERSILLGLLIFLIPMVAYFLARTLHSTAPILDAATTVLSVVAQGLVCRKKLDNWPLWCINDVLYLMLYYVKGIPFHMLMLPIYLCIAVIGFYRWQQLSRVESKLTAKIQPILNAQTI